MVLFTHFGYRIRLDARGRQVFVSSGPGVEQEVMNTLFRAYFDREDEFCSPLINEYKTLSAFPNTRSSDLSALKREKLIMFGAVTALALIYGSYPAHLNPLLLIYFLNHCQLPCLHRDLIFLYFPSLGVTLDNWLALDHMEPVVGPQFLQHFSTFHNVSEV